MACNNVGIRHVLAHGADYVWLLTNDTVVEPEALTQLVRRMRKRLDAGMYGSMPGNSSHSAKAM